jgi:hypothetical protein
VTGSAEPCEQNKKRLREVWGCNKVDIAIVAKLGYYNDHDDDSDLVPEVQYTREILKIES